MWVSATLRRCSSVDIKGNQSSIVVPRVTENEGISRHVLSVHTF